MRLEQAEAGIKEIQKNVDSLIVINNDKLRELYGNLGYRASFAKADEVLTTAARGIAEVITKHYDTNIDLRDAKTVWQIQELQLWELESQVVKIKQMKPSLQPWILHC